MEGIYNSFEYVTKLAVQYPLQTAKVMSLIFTTYLIPLPIMTLITWSPWFYASWKIYYHMPQDMKSNILKQIKTFNQK